MVKLRVWFVALTAWLVFLFNIEQVVNEIDITKYTYVGVALIAIVALLVPSSRRWLIWGICGLSSVLVVIIKISISDSLTEIWDPNLGLDSQFFMLTITEIFSIVLTGFFGIGINRYLTEFDKAVSKIAIQFVGLASNSFAEEQDIMYKEFKRARLYKRPLSLLTVKITPESLPQQLPEIVKSYRAALLNRMAIASVAGVLDEILFENDIIAVEKDVLIITSPELDLDNLNKLLDKIRKNVADKTGFALEIGTAGFPEDAVTFEQLVEKAMERMKDSEQ